MVSCQWQLHARQHLYHHQLHFHAPSQRVPLLSPKKPNRLLFLPPPLFSALRLAPRHAPLFLLQCSHLASPAPIATRCARVVVSRCRCCTAPSQPAAAPNPHSSPAFVSTRVPVLTGARADMACFHAPEAVCSTAALLGASCATPRHPFALRRHTLSRGPALAPQSASRRRPPSSHCAAGRTLMHILSRACRSALTCWLAAAARGRRAHVPGPRHARQRRCIVRCAPGTIAALTRAQCGNV
jgi:hypothetical protein